MQKLQQYLMFSQKGANMTAWEDLMYQFQVIRR